VHAEDIGPFGHLLGRARDGHTRRPAREVETERREIGWRLVPEAARPDPKVQPERLGAPCELLPDAAEAQEGQGLPEHASGR
jgi:hypothetical protein